MLLASIFEGIAVRGLDASGYASLRGDNLEIAKHHWSSVRMAGSKKFIGAISRQPDLFIGHSRAATQGDPIWNMNNHPFFTSDYRYILVHNGWIWADHLLDDKITKRVKGDCDSEVLLRVFEHEGLIKGFETVFNVLSSNGMFAVLMIDTISKSIIAFKESVAPIYIADLTNECGGVFIASTPDIISKSLWSLTKGSENGGLHWLMANKIKRLESGKLYCWAIDSKNPEILAESERDNYMIDFNYPYRGGYYE